MVASEVAKKFFIQFKAVFYLQCVFFYRSRGVLFLLPSILLSILASYFLSGPLDFCSLHTERLLIVDDDSYPKMEAPRMYLDHDEFDRYDYSPRKKYNVTYDKDFKVSFKYPDEYLGKEFSLAGFGGRGFHGNLEYPDVPAMVSEAIKKMKDDSKLNFSIDKFVLKNNDSSKIKTDYYPGALSDYPSILFSSQGYLCFQGSILGALGKVMLFAFSIAAFLVTGTFVNFYLEDRKKRLIDGFRLSGLLKSAYLLGNLSFELFLFSIIALLSTIAFNIPHWFGVAKSIAYFFLVFLLFTGVLLQKVLLADLLPNWARIRKFLSVVLHLGIAVTAIYVDLTKVSTLLSFVSPYVSFMYGIYSLFLNLFPEGHLPNYYTMAFGGYIGISIAHSALIVIIICFKENVSELLMGNANGKKSLSSSSGPRATTVMEESNEHEVESSTVLNVQGMTKSFSNGTLALDNVTMKIRKGEIYSLLGHNGSGKSTLFSIITGSCEASRGTFEINSKTIGFCPQSDTLYDALTVKDHLEFMRAIRCASVKALYEIVHDFGLGTMLDQTTRTLSGGQKRLLCTAMAFLGSPSLVILDEPTSGMDPKVRAKLWALIQARRATSSIVLCTHFMDEAEYLSDRIGFLSFGHLKCVGSVAFFRKVFQCGHSLTLHGMPASSLSRATEIIKRHHSNFSERTLIEGGGYEFSISCESAPTALIADLEGQSEALGFSSISIKENSLEAIFSNSELFDSSTSMIQKSAPVNQQDAEEASTKAFISTLTNVRPRSQIDVFFAILIFYVKSLMTQWLDLSIRIVCLGLLTCSIFIPSFVMNSVGSENNPTIYNNVETFEHYAMGSKIYYDCKHPIPEGFEGYLITDIPETNHTAFGSIECDSGNNWVIVRNSLYPHSRFFMDYVFANVLLKTQVSKSASFKYEKDKKPTESISSSSAITEDLKKSALSVFKLTILAVVQLITLLLGLNYAINKAAAESQQNRFLMYVFGASPLSYYAATFIRNSLVLVLNSVVIAIQASFLDDKFSDFKDNLWPYFFLVIIYTNVIGTCLGTISKKTTVLVNAFGSIFPMFILPLFQLFKIPVYPMTFVLPAGYKVNMGDANGNVELLAFTNIGIIAMTVCSCVGLLGIAAFEYCHVFMRKDAVATQNMSMGELGVKRGDDDGLVVDSVCHPRGLNSLCLEVRPNELVCLMGRNGAGKSTTMSIILSQLTPSAGSVLSQGVDVHYNKFKAWKSLSFCPQTNDFLIPALSTRAHLSFFANLGGHVDVVVRDQLITHLARAFKFEEHLDKQSQHLSGGTKRKLCAAISFLSPGSLVVLDEPTTGVDAAARETMWTLLRSVKSAKSILVTTHYLSEGSQADNIAFLSSGRIACKGSEYEICKSLGKGYTLKVQVADNDATSSSSSVAAEDIELVFDGIVSASRMEATSVDKVNEFNYKIREASFTLSALLQRLDNLVKAGRITSYSLNRAHIEWDDFPVSNY